MAIIVDDIVAGLAGLCKALPLEATQKLLGEVADTMHRHAAENGLDVQKLIQNEKTVTPAYDPDARRTDQEG
jgi:hypothetical protein